MKLYASDLREGDMYDATPLVESLIALLNADEVPELAEFADDSRRKAECMYFEVECVEVNHNGGYVVYGEPLNLPAAEGQMVEVMEV